MTHWILIADASGARVFSTTGRNKPLELVRDIPNPQGRLRTSELTSDQSGRLNKAGSPGTRSAIEPHTTAHEEAAAVFARDLAKFFQHELGQDSYTSVSLVAPPHFLGMLRPLLGKDVEQRLRGSLAEDLVHIPAHELRPHLESLLFAPGLFL